MNWFFSSGDAPFFWPEQLRELTFYPDTWYGEVGFGQSMLPSLWVHYPFTLITWALSQAGLSWFFIDKFWWALVFGLALFGSFKLARFVGITKKFSYIASVIYTTNTYILLLFDGGQLGVAFAYALVPLSYFYAFSYFLKKKGIYKKNPISVGMSLSFLVMADIRIAFAFFVSLLLFVCVLYWKKMLNISKEIGIIFLLLVGLNFYWIFPTVQHKNSLSGQLESLSKTTTDLSFFSVADISHSFSLLHPNYPENLFGRIYFFKPEFIILPFLAFSILLFKKRSTLLLTFGIVALLGGFLGKGVGEPFGSIYSWLFTHVPGFFLFRDPTKWYVLTAVSYTILIPSGLEEAQKKLEKFTFILKNGSYLTKILPYFAIAVFCLFWVYTLRYVFLGVVSGNSTPPRVTSDYIRLSSALTKDQETGRVLWLPSFEKFGFRSNIHPSLTALEVFSESSTGGVLRQFEEGNAKNVLAHTGISYVIVPQDIEKKIFLDNYEYNPGLRSDLIAILDKQNYLQKIDEYEELAVYAFNEPESFFSINKVKIESENLGNTWSMNVPELAVEKELSVAITYDPNWEIHIKGKRIKPEKTEDNFMVFRLPPCSNSLAQLQYVPQKTAEKGAFISIALLILLVVVKLLIFFRKLSVTSV